MRESLRRLASEEAMQPPRRAGRRRCAVELIDGETLELDVQRKAKGGELLDLVCQHLGVDERDYFGLQHAERGDPRVWVDLNRRLSKTFKNSPWEVRLAVKFYPPEPADLAEDITRDQLMYAVRRDLIEGRLSCSLVTHALLGSYLLQAELGDAECEVTGSQMLRHRVAPPRALSKELEEKINDLYAMHKGQNPAEAVQNYLENAKKLPLYGAELHCARDADDVDLVIGVCAGGISIYRDGLLMNRFPWAKLTKISYNKKCYTLKLRPSEFDEFETSLSFRLPATRACKKLWRCSVEHHMFFRRAEAVTVEKVRLFPRLGSRRLSCRRTLRQLRADATDQRTQITA
ncbi:band 4.1-like protein 1 [Plutella xylostella]|uniref:band 4.1-like protein 1 n=1 Tax=Plutella xylostella TaxID=51655 RepID=UPI0020323EA7|nr:band 4.1-like protein 1 [Plutella xylostella]